jgi:hypothetical protein
VALAAVLQGIIAVYSGLENCATFRRVRKIARSSYYIRPVCPSNEITGVPLNGFSWNIFVYFSKIRVQMKINTGNVRVSVTQARSLNHCCHCILLSIMYPEYVSVASVIQHAVRMHHVILTSVASLSLYHIFEHSLINRTNSLKTLLNQKKFWFSLRPLCETSSILRRIQRYTIHLRRFSFMQIHHLGLEFHMSGQTNMTKLILACRNVSNTQSAARTSERVSIKFVIGKF